MHIIKFQAHCLLPILKSLNIRELKMFYLIFLFDNYFYTVWYLNILISQVLILWSVISFYGTCNLTYININLIFPRKFEAIMFMSEQIPSKKFSMHPGFSNRPLMKYFLFHWFLIRFWKLYVGNYFEHVWAIHFSLVLWVIWKYYQYIECGIINFMTSRPWKTWLSK